MVLFSPACTKGTLTPARADAATAPPVAFIIVRRVIYSVAASLDGFIAGLGGEFDWIPRDPTINWSKFMSRFDTVLIGRHTYEIMAGQNWLPPGGNGPLDQYGRSAVALNAGEDLDCDMGYHDDFNYANTLPEAVAKGLLASGLEQLSAAG